MTQATELHAFDTESVRMQAQFLVTFQTPEDEAERILDELTRIVPLTYGNYDKCALVSAPGIEHYRPLDGAASGPEDQVRKRPGVAMVSFLIPRDQALLEQTVEQIFAVHCYEEPVITVQEVLASLSRGRSDKDNPHRWWNASGDWMKQAETVS